VEELREAATVESSKKTSTMVELQNDLEEKIAQGVAREKELTSRIESELVGKAAFKRKVRSNITFFKAKIEGLEWQMDWVRESRDHAEEEAADLRDGLSKAEALRAEEVARAVDFEKALAKSEALCA
jgi:hypothetical protein